VQHARGRAEARAPGPVLQTRLRDDRPVPPRSPSRAPDWQAIGRDLLAMAEEDRAVRDALEREGALSDGYHPRMEAVHRENARRLSEILDAHGWPRVSCVGGGAAGAARLIVQHAVRGPAPPRRGGALLTDARAAREAPAPPRAV